MSRSRILCGILLVAVLPVETRPQTMVVGAEPTPRQAEFFENEIRPLLATHCWKCHGEEEQKGGLRLDSRKAILRGGESGAAIVIADDDSETNASLLLQAVRYESLEMPPDRRLGEDKVRNLQRWIAMGAPWPGSQQESHTGSLRAFEITDEDRAYWAFQPVRRPSIPDRNGEVDHPIDAILADRLKSKGLQANGRAIPRHLVRRAYVDLTGLPPSHEEVSRFAAEASPIAWSRLIDRLLASPRYGERWGRHWLDVVRFGQTNGYERDDEKPYAWRYRDWVIDALNQDMPYDQFVMRQLAADEMEDVEAGAIAATGFYRLGVWDDEPDDKRAAEFDELDDILSSIGQAFLGMTIGCARCHDHMFDPVSQKDYYELLSFVRNIRRYEKPKEDPSSAILRPFGDSWSLAVSEQGKSAAATHVLVRGNAGTPGEEVEPQFLEVLGDQPAEIAPRSESASSCGRRLSLARWITSPENPLTARVIVNRLWQHHFGRGLVATPNDFGRAGQGVSHPELLDWLASELIASGWSIKHLHRTIMKSAAYQMSSSMAENPAVEQDPGNQLVWRQTMRRLDAESLRDAMLSVSAELNREMHGRSVFPRLSGSVVAGQSRPGRGWGVSSDDQRARRSVYLFVKRGLRDPLMESFDYVNTDSPIGSRPTTTVAPQALILLNSRFTRDRCAEIARRVIDDVGDDAEDQIAAVYRRMLARDPSDDELAIALRFLQHQRGLAEASVRQLRFAPDVPVSLFNGYRQLLEGPDYVDGPNTGWEYYTGSWGGGYEQIEVVDKTRGPFVLWRGSEFDDVVVSGSIQLQPSTERASLLLRATVKDNNWEGVAVELRPRTREVVLVQQPGGRQLARFEAEITTAAPIPFRAEWVGSRLRVFVGNPVQPQIDHEPEQAPAKGRFGLAVWGGAVILDQTLIELDDKTLDVAVADGRRCDESIEGRARRRALAELCQVILNLNEFIYID